MPLPKFEQKYSYADYLTWDEGERWELLDGVPYMQVAPSRIHQDTGALPINIQIEAPAKITPNVT